MSDEDEVIEFACSSLIQSPAPVAALSEEISIAVARFSSARRIAVGAMAAHHILEEDLQGLPPFPGFDTSRGIVYIVAHNVDFDWKMLKSPKVMRICTVALCRSIFPESDSHSLSAMVYHLLDDKQLARKIVRNAHSAKTDVEILLDIVLPKILERLGDRVTTWGDLWEISEEARIPKIMPYGKHYGMAIADVPGGYKHWLLGQPDVDPYLRTALMRK